MKRFLVLHCVFMASVIPPPCRRDLSGFMRMSGVKKSEPGLLLRHHLHGQPGGEAAGEDPGEHHGGVGVGPRLVPGPTRGVGQDE